MAFMDSRRPSSNVYFGPNTDHNEASVAVAEDEFAFLQAIDRQIAAAEQRVVEQRKRMIAVIDDGKNATIAIQLFRISQETLAMLKAHRAVELAILMNRK